METLKRYWKLIVLAVAVLLAFLEGRGCNRPVPLGGSPASTVLKDGDTKRITVLTNGGTVRVTTQNSDVRLQGVRHVEITQDKAGDINVVAPEHGFTFEPGISVFGTTGGGRVGLDAALFYYKRLDLLVGFGGNQRGLSSVVGYVALGYTPPIEMLSNVDLFAGVGTNRTAVLGLRVAF